MKTFKVKIKFQKTVTVTEDDWVSDGGIGEFDEFAAVSYAKGCLIEDIINNPNYGSYEILKKTDE